jgi:hypothetical protein
MESTESGVSQSHGADGARARLQAEVFNSPNSQILNKHWSGCARA